MLREPGSYSNQIHTMNNVLLVGEDRRKYILAGKATVTIRNPETGIRFTYKVKPPRGRDDAAIRYVSVLRGRDNTVDYQYIGYINPQGFHYGGGRASVSSEAQSFRAFAWFWSNLTSNRVEVWHEGKCGRCGRKLTSEFAQLGFGPECIQLMR